MDPILDVTIRDDGIRLGQFLKLAGFAEHGAAAKEMLEAGEVTVGGRTETRRGRRLVGGDVVAAGGARARVVVTDAAGVGRGPGADVPADRVERRGPPDLG